MIVPTSAPTATGSLLLFSLGPVQEFIAAGRRTADLWAGSLLLSHLAQAAIEAVEAEAPEAAFLFPSREGRSGDAGRAAFPNRFLARAPAGTDADVLARHAEDALRAHLREAATFALGRLGLDPAPAEHAAAFVDVYWAALPEDAAVGPLFLDRGPDAYGHLYRVVEGLSGSRKALRNFDGGAESGYRCTLMPGQPALVPDGDPGPDEVRRWWNDLAARSGGRLRAGERLSAIALAKRFYPDFLAERGRIGREDAAFPSTSSFATADFVRAVLDHAADPALAEAAAAFDRAARALDDLRPTEAALPALVNDRPNGLGQFRRVSGRLLIGDDLTAAEALREMGADPDSPAGRQRLSEVEAKVQDLNDVRRDLMRAAARAGINPPSRYYALLVLDGDRMGEWLSGSRAPGAFGGATGAERHRAISRALNSFALERVPAIVEKHHRGRLVYGGGDDVVALLSFETALDAATAISTAFREALPGGTVSAGLVYAHHMTPLEQVLRAAREAEQRAKRAGRDRVCITALKRSGGPEAAVLPWDQLRPLRHFAELIEQKAVSTGFLHDLGELRRRLADAQGHLPADLLAPLRAEAKRLFARRIERMEEARRATAFGETFGQMLADAEDKPEQPADGHPAPHPFDAALDRLAVAQFLGKGGDR